MKASAILALVITTAIVLIAVVYHQSVSNHRQTQTGDALQTQLIRCGSRTCDPQSEYCELVKTDVASIPNTYACQPLPSACNAAVTAATNSASPCGCFPTKTRCQFCTLQQQGGQYFFQRTCVGGGAGNVHHHISN